MKARQRHAFTSIGVVSLITAVAACGCDDRQTHDRQTPPGALPSPAESDHALALLARLRATFPGAARDLSGESVHVAAARARIDVPRSAGAPSRLADPQSGVTAAFRLQNTHDVPVSVAGGAHVLAGALPGADVVHVPRTDGVEDFVAFEVRPAEEAIAYVVDLSGVAGLRLVGRQLELLDALGAPRLRVAPPYVVDARGVRIDADIDVTGCAVDRDPRPPWGRPVVPPGAASCAMRVRWTGGTYPLLVDPAWTTTGALSVKRRRHAVVALPSGHAFAIGGTSFVSNDVNTPLASTELYDAATGTWAAGAPLPVGRVGHSAIVLGDGRVVVAGGEVIVNGTQGPTKTSVFYDPASAKWSAGPDMVSEMADFASVLLANGRVLAVKTSAQELDPKGAGAWSAAGTQTFDTSWFALAASSAPYNKAIVTGGDRTTFLNHVYESSCFVYDAVARTWTKSPNAMKAARSRHTAVTLADGRVLMAGGQNGGTTPEQSSETYDWATDTWTSAGTMSLGRDASSMIVLGNKSVLIAGDGTSSELFDPVIGAWSPGGTMTDARLSAPLVLLPSGEAMIVGGDSDGTAVLASAERFGTATGKACTSGGQCTTGHCVDGVCCATTCDGDCVACSAAAKGGGSDGVCEPVPGGKDPRARCSASKPETCGASGKGCDGAGQCTRYGAETACRAPQCTGGAETRFLCDGAGVCQAHGASCGVYACDGAACKTACDVDADCVSGSVCDSASRACVSTTRCASNHEQQNPDGTATDCGAYRCAGVACVATCASVDDCRDGYVCDKDAHCVVPSAAPHNDGGCAIGRDGARGAGGASVAGLLALAGALRRRRRR